MDVVSKTLQKKIDDIILAKEICSKAQGCSGCPFKNDGDCKVVDFSVEVIEELIELSTVAPTLESNCKMLNDKLKRFEKHGQIVSKRTERDVKTITNYINKGSEKWTILDAWRCGFIEGSLQTNSEWINWVEENFNE